MKDRLQKYVDRHAALVQIREPWMRRCEAIAAMLMPWRGPLRPKDRTWQRDTENWRAVIDDVGSSSLTGLVNGMMSASMSASQDWFAARIGGQFDAMPAVREWTDDATKLIHRVFQRSNVYQVSQQVVYEQGAFGTGVALVVPDPETIIRLQFMPAGEYCLAEDAQGRPNTVYRDLRMTVAQMVEQFGIDRVSREVRRQFELRDFDALVPLVHVIEPRELRDRTKADQLNMPFRSIYFDANAGSDDDILAEGGFERLPVLVVPWDRTPGSAYGHGPGVYAYRAIEQLQAEHIQKGRSINYQTQPPLGFDIAAKGQGINLMPGSINYVGPNAGTGSRALFESRLDLNALREDMEEVRQRIRKAFHVDLFRMFGSEDRSGVTALEIAKRYEENLLQLANVAQRNEDNLQEPLVEHAFHLIAQAGLFLPPPSEIQARPINLQFLGLLAQAQQSRPILAMERFMGQVAAVATVWPDALDLVNVDEFVQQTSTMLQIPPKLVRRPEDVADLRIARQQAAAAQEQAMLGEQQSKTAKQLSEARPSPSNLLGQLQAQGVA